MDWTTLLRCQQADFLNRLQYANDREPDDPAGLSPLLEPDCPGVWCERVEIAGDRLTAIRARCREQILTSDPGRPVRDLWTGYLANRLAEAAVMQVWTGQIERVEPDRTVAPNAAIADLPDAERTPHLAWHKSPQLGIRAIAVTGQTLPPQVSSVALNSAEIGVWVWVREALDESRTRYNPVVLGFLPGDRRPKGSVVELEQLWYGGGLRGYLASVAETGDRRTASSQEWLRPVMGSSNCAYPLAIAADGRTVVSSSYDGSLKLWRMGDRQIEARLAGRSWSLSPSNPGSSGQTLSSSHANRVLQHEHSGSGELIRALPGPRSGVGAVILDPQGERLICGSRGGAIEIWQVDTGEKQQVLKAHRAAVLMLAVSADGSTFASGSADRTLRVWRVRTGEAVRAFSLATEGLSSVALSPNGTAIAYGFQSGQIEIWQVDTGERRYRTTAHAGAVRSLAISDDGGQLASGSIERTLKLWNAETGDLEGMTTGYPDPLIAVAPSPNGRWIELNLFQHECPGWQAS